MAFSIKMRAEKGSRHVSGAERIVERAQAAAALEALARRALEHPNGEPDTLTLTVRAITLPILHLPPLPVLEPAVRDAAAARAVLAAELRRLGLDPERVLPLLYNVRPMRGAVLLHADSLQRLEPDQARGVRATCMDYVGNDGGGKRHMQEALCLATKVAHCPWIIGELCISDDPDYTIGYFAARGRGYVRIPHIKERGSEQGGRVFLFRGGADDVPRCIDYLERQPVMVELR
ncbi:6-carboxyhexanoate--CoA ligase [Desulfovibrio legallii]|jgi:6-carboxyhexanoate--CoA ligase|uniref:6-carboxyhexanoate--CoA ligase n=1 Tax=Desulfovibrio legallii TaxID=571438 RepID=A0A1G7NEZ7_9BACT|nr:6-carboxyhexanoate--CoA ligase [Desulfovibrio legallii]SDF72487.1 6-carboxyhexanoate--CoA ligase [Desulfovibrio legallii]